MLEPYSDKPEESGIMRTPEEAWMSLIDDFVRNVCASDRNMRILACLEANRAFISIGLANCMCQWQISESYHSQLAQSSLRMLTALETELIRSCSMPWKPLSPSMDRVTGD